MKFSKMPFILLGLCLLATIASLPTFHGSTNAQSNISFIVVLVRHADAAYDGKRELTPAGLKRAGELAQSLRYAGITGIFTSDTARTQQTAAPLAELIKVAPRTFRFPTKKQVAERKQHHQDVVTAVRANAPGASLIVGHETTVPAFIRELGGPEIPNLCSTVHDELFVLEVSVQTKLILGRYGEITECKREKETGD